jgi:hypothetical protein
MNHIKDLLSPISLTNVREENNFKKKINPHIVDLINRIFLKFWGICPGFETQFQSEQKLAITKQEWVLAFMDIGLDSIEKTDVGTSRCRFEGCINIPTIKDFVSWCRQTDEELGFLSSEDAYDKAMEINRQFSDFKEKLSEHQMLVLRHTIRETGSYKLRTLPEATSWPIFKRKYEIAIRDYRAGKLLPIPEAIEDKRQEIPKDGILPQYAPIKTHTACMESIKGIIKIKPIENGL